VSKQIVEKHEGTIMVRSACGESRHGTVFYISLPIKKVASAVSGTD
jgi:signal transduction histidine kinase